MQACTHHAGVMFSKGRPLNAKLSPAGLAVALCCGATLLVDMPYHFVARAAHRLSLLFRNNIPASLRLSGMLSF